MDRLKEIKDANPYSGTSEVAYGKEIGFIIGAKWADAHPKEVDNDCEFCREMEVVTHSSKECNLSLENGTMYAEVDIPTFGCSASGIYGFSINYCPMCGRKLKTKE